MSAHEKQVGLLLQQMNSKIDRMSTISNPVKGGHHQIQTTARDVIAHSQQLATLSSEVFSLVANVETLREKLSMPYSGQLPMPAARPGAGQSGPEQYVSVRKHVEAYDELKRNIQYWRDEQEHAAIKAGYLAIAAASCDASEKQAMFQKLKAQEDILQMKSLISQGESPEFSEIIDVELDRSSGAKIGADIDGEEDTTLLKVTDVFDGLLKDWNRANPSRAVSAGDVILCVNNAKGHSAQMIEELGVKGLLKLSIARKRLESIEM